MKPLYVAALVLCSVACVFGSSQVSFDVVSLKPDMQATGLVSVGCRGSDGTVPPWRVVPMGMCVASRATARMLVEFAYEVGRGMTLPVDGTLAGAPDWFATDRFALQAKAENPPMLKELRTMLQMALAEQLKLRGHIETRQVDGYTLVVGKNGPKLDPEETVERRDRPSSSLQRASGSVTLRTTLGFSMHTTGGGGYVITSRNLNLRNVTMDDVARWLANEVGKPVVNETMIEGTYNLLTDKFSTGNDADSQAPSLSTVMDQVGLKLQSQKVSIPVFVIEHVEKPTFN